MASSSQGSLSTAWPGHPLALGSLHTLSLWSSVPSCLAVGAMDRQGQRPRLWRSSLLSPTSPASRQGLVYFICKGPDCKHFRLCRPFSLYYSYSPLPCGSKTKHTPIECGCVRVKFMYGCWNLNFIWFLYVGKYYPSLDFFFCNLIKMQKPFFVCKLYKNRRWLDSACGLRFIDLRCCPVYGVA